MRINFEAYGCTLNKGESQLMRERASNAGHVPITDHALETADVHVISTCTVIGKTERKMLGRLRVLAATGKPVIVTGCMATAQPELVGRIVGEDQLVVLPPDRILAIDEVLEGFVKGELRRDPIQFIGEQKDCIGIVPIASGCLGNCAYCITRVARGRLHSRSPDWIVDHARSQLQNGARELQLTAQDTACYGRDHNTTGPIPLLPHLIELVASLPGEFRIRVGMMDPDTTMPILDDLIHSYQHEKVFKFLHLPVQSGSDVLLNKMNRQYSVEDFKSIVRTFRTKYPELTLSTDIIVGFPSESEEQFEASMELLKAIGPDIVNITRFSPRPGTPAAAMENQIVSRIVKERSRRMTKLRFQMSLAKNRHYIGMTVQVLVTELGKPGTNTVIARDRNYRVVVVQSNSNDPTTLLGQFVAVNIIDAHQVYLIGEYIGE